MDISRRYAVLKYAENAASMGKTFSVHIELYDHTISLKYEFLRSLLSYDNREKDNKTLAVALEFLLKKFVQRSNC